MFVAFRQCSLLIVLPQPFWRIFITFQDPHAFHRFPSHSSSTLYTLHHHVPIISPHFPIMSPSFPQNFPIFFCFPHHFHPPKQRPKTGPQNGAPPGDLCRLIRRQQRVQHHQLSGAPTVARRRGVRVQRPSGEEQHRVAREVLMFAPQGHHLAMPLG